MGRQKANKSRCSVHGVAPAVAPRSTLLAVETVRKSGRVCVAEGCHLMALNESTGPWPKQIVMSSKVCTVYKHAASRCRRGGELPGRTI